MLRKLFHIVLVLFLLALLGAGIFFYGLYFAVDRTTVRYETLSDPAIPQSLDGKKIAYFSDIKYNEFMDKKRLAKIIEKINELHADILLFGGDVFSKPLEHPYDSQDVKEVSQLLKELSAPLGKFAVLGDEDMASKEVKEQVSQLLYDSDFEVLDNESHQIRNQSNDAISLIALEPMINGNPDLDAAFKNISEEEYNILLTHCPDLAAESTLNLTYIDTMLSAHSLGGQIYLPLLGPLQKTEGAETYYHGSYTINSTSLFITNGLGTTGTDMRLFAPPQVIVFRLEHTDNG